MRNVAYGLTVASLILGSLTACGGTSHSAGPTAKPGTASVPASSSPPADGSSRTISFGEQAGGLTRDHAGETANQTLLNGLNTTPAMSRYGISKLQGALYGPHVAADPSQLINISPEQVLVATTDGITLNDPQAALIDLLKDATRTSAGGKVTGTNPGPLGGAASCLAIASSGLTVNACYWADKTTFGSVTSFAKDVTQTADLMRKIRADIEKTA